jgi:hypothetical protein
MIPLDNAKTPQAYPVRVKSLIQVGTGAEPSTHSEPSTQTYEPNKPISTNRKGPSFQLPVIPDAPLPKDPSTTSPVSASPSKKAKISKNLSQPSPSEASLATKNQSSNATLKTKKVHPVPVDSQYPVGSDGELFNKPTIQIPNDEPAFSPAILGAPLSNNTSIASPVPASLSKKEKAANNSSKRSPSKASVATKNQSSNATLKAPSLRESEKTSSPSTEAPRLFATATKTKSSLDAASNNEHQGREQKLTGKETLLPNNLNKVDSKGKSNDVPKSRTAAVLGVTSTVPRTSGTNDDSNIIPLDSAMDLENRRKLGTNNPEMIHSQQQQTWLLPGLSLQMTMANSLPPFTMTLQEQQQKQTISSPPPMKPPSGGPKSPLLHPPKQQPNRPSLLEQSRQPSARPSSSTNGKRKRNSSLATTRLSPFYVREGGLSQMTPNQIQQAIPENASSVFHVLDRRVNLDASSSKDANMYCLLRSWVQDDPDRQIPPPAADISEQYNSSVAITTQPTPGYKEPIMEDHQCSKETKPTAPTTITFDMLAALRFQRQLPPKDYVRNEFLARARESRKAQHKTYALRAAAAKASLKRKGIVLP